MKKEITALLMVFVAITALNMQPVAAVSATVDINPQVLFEDDFSDPSVSSLQWVVESGVWTFTAGEYVHTSATGFDYVTVTPWTFGDAIFEAKIGQWDMYTSFIVFGYQDADNWYGAGLSIGNSKYAIYKRQGGVYTALASTGTDSDLVHGYHNVRVVFESPSIELYVDGNLELSASDSTFTSGKFGLGANMDNKRFDDVVVLEAAPATLNKRNKGKWISGRIGLYDVSKIDISSVKLTPIGGPTEPITSFSDNFNGHADYTHPDGWSVVSGSWTVIDGEYVHTSATGFDYVTVSSITHGSSATFEAKIGQWDMYTAFIVFGYQDADNWYGAGLSIGNSKYAIYKREGGVYTALASTGTDSDLAWGYHNVTVVFNSGSMELWVDEVLELTASDSAFSGGRFGLGANMGDKRFDDIIVTGALEQPESVMASWGDVQDGFLMVKFDRSEVASLLSAGEWELTISGELRDAGVLIGTFEGTDTLRVIEKG